MHPTVCWETFVIFALKFEVKFKKNCIKIVQIKDKGKSATNSSLAIGQIYGEAQKEFISSCFSVRSINYWCVIEHLIDAMTSFNMF